MVPSSTIYRLSYALKSNSESIEGLLFEREKVDNMTYDVLYEWVPEGCGSMYYNNYKLDFDMIQIATVDELNYLLKAYRKVFESLYSKYGMNLLRQHLEIDEYNRKMIDPLDKDWNLAKDALNVYGFESDTYLDIVHSIIETKIKETVNHFNNNYISHTQFIDRILTTYKMSSYLHGYSHRIIEHLKNTMYRDVIDRHIDDIASEIRDYAMVTNRYLCYDNGKFVSVKYISNEEKTKIIRKMAIEKNASNNFIETLNVVKMYKDANVRYNPSNVLNYLKIKKVIEK